jgi:hypothetical protein
MILITILIALFIYVGLASFYMLRKLSKLSDLLDECDDKSISDSRFDMVEKSKNEYE